MRAITMWMAALLLHAPLSAAQAQESLSAALDGPTRSAEDRARDAGRKPADVVAFLGIEPGMKMIDLIAAGGYYTEVLSLAVGKDGVVYAQNPPAVLKFRDGANDKAMTARLAGGRLANVTRLDLDLAEVTIEPGSLDAAITALNFHDIYNGRSPEAAGAFLTRVSELLKPGGVLGLIDHAGDAGANNEELHRIEESKVRSAATAAGFEIDGDSALLRSADDDHTQNVFADGLRGKTDRFLLRLRKPAS